MGNPRNHHAMGAMGAMALLSMAPPHHLPLERCRCPLAVEFWVGRCALPVAVRSRLYLSMVDRRRWLHESRLLNELWILFAIDVNLSQSQIICNGILLFYASVKYFRVSQNIENHSIQFIFILFHFISFSYMQINKCIYLYLHEIYLWRPVWLYTWILYLKLLVLFFL